MDQNSLTAIVQEQTKRALWEVDNVISCIPDHVWDKEYCHMPLWKHVYHMLHSLDLWFVNPRDFWYQEPEFHVPNLNNLDIVSDKTLARSELNVYCAVTLRKIREYTNSLEDDGLLAKPPQCEYSVFTLILAQYRHLHTHMGMIMGFVIADTGLWPRVLGLEGEFPGESYGQYF